jgi:hypothetical protein
MSFITLHPESLVGITLTSEQKSAWVSALRSSEYLQGKMSLFKGGRFCCLGVLGVTIGVDVQRMQNLAWLDSVMGPECPLGPNSLSDKVSIQDVLSSMNDGGKTFAEIADFIEANIPACDEVQP